MFFLITATAALTASIAAGLSAVLTLPVWAMFIGWVSFFTRGAGARDAVVNAACVALGLGFGMAAAWALGAVGPLLGALALPVAVFAVAIIVVSLRDFIGDGAAEVTEVAERVREEFAQRIGIADLLQPRVVLRA